MVSQTGSGRRPAPSIIEGRPWSTYVDGQEAQRISHLSQADGTEAGRERGRADRFAARRGCTVAGWSTVPERRRGEAQPASRLARGDRPFRGRIKVPASG